MEHLASLVPNHKYGCGTNCCCFCICEVSVVIYTVCEESAVTRDYWHFVVILGLSSVVITRCRSHYTMTTPRSEWALTLQAHLRRPRRPCRRGHRCSRDCLLDPRVLQADARPSEKITSHDFHQLLRVNDCSVVSGFHISPFPCIDLLNCFVQHFVGSFCHRQVPTSKCWREINLFALFSDQS